MFTWLTKALASLFAVDRRDYRMRLEPVRSKNWYRYEPHDKLSHTPMGDFAAAPNRVLERMKQNICPCGMAVPDRDYRCCSDCDNGTT